MAVFGKCKLCSQNKNLSVSHAIGNSTFKRITRTNSGKAVHMTSGDEDISYTSDSWAEHQLCSGCESLLNENYEKYSLAVLRERRARVYKTQYGITFKNVDQYKLILYILSIYWRAANSNHMSYRQVNISEKENELLRSTLLNSLNIPSFSYSIQLSKLIDGSKSGGLSEKAMKQIIVSPFIRMNIKCKNNNRSFCFTFEGYFIEIFFPALPIKSRRKKGVLCKTSGLLVVPYVNIFSINELVKIMRIGFQKVVEGKSRVSV